MPKESIYYKRFCQGPYQLVGGALLSTYIDSLWMHFNLPHLSHLCYSGLDLEISCNMTPSCFFSPFCVVSLFLQYLDHKKKAVRQDNEIAPTKGGFQYAARRYAMEIGKRSTKLVRIHMRKVAFQLALTISSMLATRLLGFLALEAQGAQRSPSET